MVGTPPGIFEIMFIREDPLPPAERQNRQMNRHRRDSEDLHPQWLQMSH